MKYLDNNNKKELTFEQLENMMKQINNGSFIFYDMFVDFMKKTALEASNKEMFAIKMFVLKFNERIYENLTKDNKQLSFRTLKFDDALLELRKNVFIGPLNREQQLEEFYEQLQQKKYYQLDDKFGKNLLSLIINLEDLRIDLNKFSNAINDIFAAYHKFTIDFFIEYYDILDEIIKNDMAEDLWNEILLDKQNNYSNRQLYERFIKKHNEIKNNVSTKAARDIYVFYATYDNKPLWLNIVRLVEIQDLYKLKSKKIFFNPKRFEKNISRFYASNLDDIISYIMNLYHQDIIARPNLKKATRWLNNLNKYIRTKDIEKFSQCFLNESTEMNDLLDICMLQDDMYNKLALEEYKLSRENKTIKEDIKEDTNIKPTKQTLIENSIFSTEIKKIMLQDNFSLEKVEYIISNINNKVLTVEFVEKNIFNLIDKVMYKRVKQNIKLFNTMTNSIIMYDAAILFEDNEILKQRIKVYTKDYKLSMFGISNFEFLLNDEVFSIINEFINLGYYKTIKLYPEYLSMNSINILKRLQIASTDPSMITLNDDLSFTDDILTGNGFPIADSELNEYISNAFLDDMANKVESKTKKLTKK